MHSRRDSAMCGTLACLRTAAVKDGKVVARSDQGRLSAKHHGFGVRGARGIYMKDLRYGHLQNRAWPCFHHIFHTLLLTPIT